MKFKFKFGGIIESWQDYPFDDFTVVIQKRRLGNFSFNGPNIETPFLLFHKVFFITFQFNHFRDAPL